MSFEEKSVWIHILLSAAVSGIYFIKVLGLAQHMDVTEIAYVRLMLTAIGIAVALSIIMHVIVASASPKDANKRDERDTNIHRYGEYVGSIVLAIGIVGALGLTMAEFAHFWIANAIYFAFALSALTSSAVKIVAYRRGF